MRISRKLSAAAVAGVAALAITACSPPNENDSSVKVETAVTQDPESLGYGQPGFDEIEADTDRPSLGEVASAEATDVADPDGLDMGTQGFVTQE